jgi:type II secretory pathway component PulC
MNNGYIKKNGYLNEDIYIVQYPEEKELCFAQRKIQLINKYNIQHSVFTQNASSVSLPNPQSPINF